jgi:hypothetical protein
MMTDEQMLHLFSRFQALRHETNANIQSRLLRHDNYRLPEEFYGIRSIVFSSMAGDFTRGLIGELNRFVINVHHADCWIRAANEYEKEKQVGLLWEFADPFLELAVGRAYSIRNHFAFAIIHLLNQSNPFKNPNWKDDLPEDRNITFEFLSKSKIGDGWNTFPQFQEKLNALNDPSFVEATRNFRNLIQHRFRLQFHTGLTTYFDRVEDNGRVSYTYKLMPPIKLEVLIPQLYTQHEKSLGAFEAYWKLLSEFCVEWMSLKPKAESIFLPSVSP